MMMGWLFGCWDVGILGTLLLLDDVNLKKEKYCYYTYARTLPAL